MASKKLTQYLNLKFLRYIAVLIVIFILGWLLGSGRLNLNQVSGKNSSLPNNLNYSTINQVYQDVKSEYDGKLTTSQILDGLKNGLVQATGDPYTEYFNPSQAQDFNSELDGSFSGIGAELGDQNNNLVVIAPLAETPAAKAGLQAKDIITAINGKSTTGVSIDQAVDDIRGPSGTQVTLSIDRNGTALTFKITRANITVPSVTSSVINGNIGYMSISQFSTDTSSLAQTAAQTFKKDNVKGVILDLRNDPGGLVTAAVNVSSLWVPGNDLIMQEKRGNTVIQTYMSTGNDILHGIPTVVLINAGSASASEITAGALHDNKAAYLIGETSFGKGSVQEINNLSGGGELKVTIAHWYRPDGKNINHIGITPDKTVAEPASSTGSGSDPQEQAAIQYLDGSP
ncbi:MAG TPA: S41 family peptidase [Candidatus Saccharimonadales bacterium]|nr:S41 family peptidase [Candidatus Saccharimonadales bacterium]